jgi:hypothetical protein
MNALVESGELGTIQFLRPGGLELTRQLAELCHLSQDKSMLDVASDTRESACCIAQWSSTPAESVSIKLKLSLCLAETR